MKIVIDIDEEIYKDCIDGFIHAKNESALIQVIKNGIPLPEHHGRLIDADELIKVADGYINMSVDSEDINDAPTIIEASEGGREIDYSGMYIGYCPKCGSECTSGIKDTECWHCKYSFELPSVIGKEK